MTYRDYILELPKQFSWRPEIVNKENLKPFRRVIVAGMGGSRLDPDILKIVHPEIELKIHSDFGLPPSGVHPDDLIIANSYSGNTAETVSAAKEALEKGLNLAIIANGGELLEIARSNSLPFIEILEKNAATRLVLGYKLVALMELIGLKENFSACSGINATDQEDAGKDLAEYLAGSIPLIYTSENYKEVGYIWRVILNETAKMPAFCNRLPELAHNELAGFMDAPKLPADFRCLILDDGNSQLAMRINKITDLYVSKGIKTKTIKIEGSLSGIISSIILAHWTGLALAEKAGVDPMSTPAIEEFKKSL